MYEQPAHRFFSDALIRWQRQQGRHDLPWQNTRDAYRIWLSEVMLQQTQVATVIPYFERFLAAFPCVEALAAASQEEVLGYWSGLGYYARARHLHRCAGVLVAQYDGRFPKDPKVIATLPGIGRSTAAAIAVFAFGAQAAILDGNVKRVLTRVFGIHGFPGTAAVERELWALAESLLPVHDPGSVDAYTQGLMDLGAILCTRRKPRCADCPVRDCCVAQREALTALLPTPKPDRIVPTRRGDVLLLRRGDHFLLEQRPSVGVWGGLWGLPEVREGETPEAAARRFGFEVRGWQAMQERQHGFTHFKLMFVPWAGEIVSVTSGVCESDVWRWLPATNEAVGQAPLPAPVRRLLKEVLR